MDENMVAPIIQPSADSSPASEEPASVQETTGRRRPKKLKFLLPFLPPVALTLLYYALEDNAAAMDNWVTNFLAPGIQAVGSLCSLVPFSVAEVLAALFLLLSAWWLIHAVVLLVKQRKLSAFLRRAASYVCVLCWLWMGFCWLWNCTYHAPGFAEKNALTKYSYTPDQLLSVTCFFALQAAKLSDDVPRNEDLSFAVTGDEAFERGVRVYDNIGKGFPSLSISDRKAKPLVCSRFQSILGYTGIYFPFTGEANVNVDQPACLVPATIAHEMAHQRMVASEDECSFIGVLACVSSEDIVFQYSGYLMGLTYLTNALYALSPELVEEIMRQSFTPELLKDWNENYHYWKALETPAREVANEVMDEVYDGYLKSQGQTLGLMSYDACVDLLVNYFYPFTL